MSYDSDEYWEKLKRMDSLLNCMCQENRIEERLKRIEMKLLFLVDCSSDSKLALALKIIEEYAQHNQFCEATINNTDPPIDAEGCTCGLTEKWRAVKG
jgi:hypothetical protein